MGNGRWLGLWMLMGTWLAAAELEVRCYRVGWDDLEQAWEAVRAQEAGDDPFESPEGSGGIKEPFVLETVAKAGFESRFLERAGELRDSGQWVGWVLDKDFKGQAVYAMATKRLVVRADGKDHAALAAVLASELNWQIRLQVSVFESLFGTGEAGPVFWKQAPEEAAELASLTTMGLPGGSVVGRSANGELLVESEGGISNDADFIALRLFTRFRVEAKQFEVATDLELPLGVTWVERLGSVDGKSSVLLAVRADLVGASGEWCDEWILKEDEGAFLRDERLQRLRRSAAVKKDLGGGREYREFSPTPGFWSYLGGNRFTGGVSLEKVRKGIPKEVAKAPELQGWEEEPFWDFREILQDNGLNFEEGDYAVFAERSHRLLAKGESVQMALLDALMESFFKDQPRMIHLECVQWEGGEMGETTGERVVQAVSGMTVPGNDGIFQLGEDLILQFEGFPDLNGERVEIRPVFSEVDRDLEKASFDTQIVLDDDKPFLIQESRVGGKRRAWVLKARVIEIGRELDAFLGAAE